VSQYEIVILISGTINYYIYGVSHFVSFFRLYNFCLKHFSLKLQTKKILGMIV